MSDASGAAAGAPQGGAARVRYGVHSRVGDNTGKTVRQVREELSRQWNLPGDATAFNGTTKLDDDYVIKAGDSLEFHRRQGEKG